MFLTTHEDGGGGGVRRGGFLTIKDIEKVGEGPACPLSSFNFTFVEVITLAPVNTSNFKATAWGH